MTIAYTLLWGVITSHLLSFPVTELVSEHPWDQKVPILKQVLAQEFVYAFPRTSDSRLLEVAVLRTETVRDISEFSQQDGKKEGTANARVWQMWQGYYKRVLSWSSLNIIVFWSKKT